jgi:hypothetical protein
LLHADVDVVDIVAILAAITLTTTPHAAIVAFFCASSAPHATIVVNALDGDVAVTTGGNCFSSTPANCTWLEGDLRDRRSAS